MSWFPITGLARPRQTISLWTLAALRLTAVCSFLRSSGMSILVTSLRASSCPRRTGLSTVFGLISGRSCCYCCFEKNDPITDNYISDGSYTQYCDLSRQYDPVPSPNTTNALPNGTVVPAYNGSGIGTFLEPFGRYDLLDYMNKYWIAQNSPNQDLWAVSP